jgi:hypothetical protein
VIDPLVDMKIFEIRRFELAVITCNQSYESLILGLGMLEIHLESALNYVH